MIISGVKFTTKFVNRKLSIFGTKKIFLKKSNI